MKRMTKVALLVTACLVVAALVTGGVALAKDAIRDRTRDQDRLKDGSCLSSDQLKDRTRDRDRDRLKDGSGLTTEAAAVSGGQGGSQVQVRTMSGAPEDAGANTQTRTQTQLSTQTRDGSCAGNCVTAETCTRTGNRNAGDGTQDQTQTRDQTRSKLMDGSCGNCPAK